MTTQFELHVQTWKNCTACHYSQTRTHVVLARGELPSTVVFVGEAPGQTEDTAGNPFVGKAGRMLDTIIQESVPPDTLSYSLTNLVGCLPVDPDTRERGVEPAKECVEACSPRLLELLEIANPKLIVCVGSLATKYLDPQVKGNVFKYRNIKWSDGRYPTDVPRISILHPAYILRAPIVQQGILRRKCIIAIRDGIKEYVK